MNRFTVPARRQFDNENISIVILCSDRVAGRPFSIKKVGGEYLINSQLALIKKIFGQAIDIVIVTGYDSSAVEAFINRTVRIVVNEKYDNVDIGHSILLGIKNTTSKNLYIVDGSRTLSGKEFIASAGSYITVDEVGEIGLLVQDGRVINFSYGLSPKAGSVLYLAGSDVNRFSECYRDDLLFFELLNEMLNRGMAIRPIYT